MSDEQRRDTVVIADIHVPFWSMVILMVKWAIAAIPALLLLMGVWFVGVAILGGLASVIGQARDLVNAPTKSKEAQVQRPSAPVLSKRSR